MPKNTRFGIFMPSRFSTVVEFVHGLAQFCFGDGGEITVVWKVLSHQTIAVLVQTSFTGYIGMCEEELG